MGKVAISILKNKVSVIMPVYNGENFIERSILSVLGQSYLNIELIIVDDGSTDRTRSICEKIIENDSRVILISKTNQGVSRARNVGIERASGDYITFIDADDYLDTGSIEYMVNTARAKEVDVVRVGWRNIRSNGRVEPNKEKVEEGLYVGGDKLFDISYRVCSGEMHSYAWALMIKSEVLTKNKVLFLNSVSMMEDTCFYVDLLRSINSLYVSKSLYYNYVLHSDSASRSRVGFSNKIKDIIEVNSYVKKDSFSIEQIKNINSSHLSVIANMLMARVDSVLDRRGISELLSVVSGYKDVEDIYRMSDLSHLDAYHRLEVSIVMRNNIFLVQLLKLMRNLLGR